VNNGEMSLPDQQSICSKEVNRFTNYAKGIVLSILSIIGSR